MMETASAILDQWLSSQSCVITVNLVAFSEQPFVTHGADICETVLDSVLKWEQSHGKAEVVWKPAMEGEAADIPPPLQLPL
jgi:hypothetical protein